MLSGYKAMWVVVMFDLPVSTSAGRKSATAFRNFLLWEGYFMKQFSIYMKYFVNKDKADASLKRISGKIPLYGNVSCLFITDKQFGNTQNFYGKKRESNEKKPKQFDFF